jgi:hypothetical protein
VAAIVVTVAGILGYGAVSGWFNLGASAKKPPVAVTFNYARDAAVAGAYDYNASSWFVVNAGAAIVPATRMPGGAFLTMTTVVKTCTGSFGIYGNLTVPGFSGNLSLGESPYWYFWLSNGQGGLVLFSVVNGTAAWLGEAYACSPPSPLSNITAIPETAVDSHGGGAFVAAHGPATITLTVFGQTEVPGSAQPPLWFVNYTTCPLSTTGSPAGATQEWAQSFIVFADNGTLDSVGLPNNPQSC